MSGTTDKAAGLANEALARPSKALAMLSDLTN